MIIVGAGLSGLIAAYAFPNLEIVEAAAQPQPHKALLRFRSTKVADLTGIPFKRVRVHKGIWHEGEHRQPNIELANMYSMKVTHRLLSRSIWDIEPCDRYVAPEDFINQMIDHCRNRITFNERFDYDSPCISTAPMWVPLEALGYSHDEDFRHAGIEVRRFRLNHADVYQTMYFPSPATAMYRASVTGSLLIVEFTHPPNESDPWEMMIAESMYIAADNHEETVSQSRGKISPINEAARRAFIYDLTTNHKIYSLGRFATWRNILLDDVVDDIQVIRQLTTMGDYARQLHWRP